MFNALDAAGVAVGWPATIRWSCQSHPCSVAAWPEGPDWPADRKHVRDRKHLHRHVHKRRLEQQQQCQLEAEKAEARQQVRGVWKDGQPPRAN